MKTDTTVTLNLFEKRLKHALKLFNKPERLGAESPLASAYFLSNALRNTTQPLTSQTRSALLCDEIRAAAAQLWQGDLPASREAMQAAIYDVRREPDNPRYAYLVLELRCFQHYIQLNRTSDIWEQPHVLPGSKSQHYRDFDLAIKALGDVLLNRLRPVLRLERPLPPSALVGYDDERAQIVSALAQGATVAVTGPGGVGKTSLAATLMAHDSADTIFWYTLRPGFNDNVNSLLFALGYFLYSQDATQLWQCLVAAGGAVDDLNVALGLLRQDLTGLQDRPPVLCFDELEYLHAADGTFLPAGRMQVLDLLDGLRGSVPMLLISQRPVLEVDRHIELAGLAVAEIQQLWQATGHALGTIEAEQLHRYTGGNPRMLLLCLALSVGGQSVFEIVASTTATSGFLPAFSRVWRRLSPDERRLAQRLAVFRSAAPAAVWEPVPLAALTELRLVERDHQGGVALLPVLREIITGELSTELREQLHRQAAAVRLEFAEYTAAAYHFWQGNQEYKAVQVWFPQRQREMLRGEGVAALAVFDGISQQRLGKPERKAISLIRAELRRMFGEAQQGLAALEQSDWGEASEAIVQAWLLRGEFQEALGYPDAALDSYADGVRATARLMGQLARFHQRRGTLHLQQRELAQSRREIDRAEYELSLLRGRLLEEEGQYGAAETCYQQALDLATQLGDDSATAAAERYMARLFGRRQQLDRAIEHAQRTMMIYERIGDRVNLEKMRSNLAAIYVQTGQFHAAVEVGREAYRFFQRVQDPYFAAVTGANIAEAHYELGELANAEHTAFEVLNLEDRHAVPYAYFTLGQVRRAEQRWPDADAYFAQAITVARQNDDPYMVAYAQRALGQVRLDAGQPAAAHEPLIAARERFQQLALDGEVAATEQLLNTFVASNGE